MNAKELKEQNLKLIKIRLTYKIEYHDKKLNTQTHSMQYMANEIKDMTRYISFLGLNLRDVSQIIPFPKKKINAPHATIIKIRTDYYFNKETDFRKNAYMSIENTFRAFKKKIKI